MDLGLYSLFFLGFRIWDPLEFRDSIFIFLGVASDLKKKEYIKYKSYQNKIFFWTRVSNIYFCPDQNLISV